MNSLSIYSDVYGFTTKKKQSCLLLSTTRNPRLLMAKFFSQGILKLDYTVYSFAMWWNKESEILNSHLKCFSLEKHIGVRRKEVTVNHATSYEILCER
jgi:hypothetical protein